MNNCGEFGRSWRKIYPKELELKCEFQGDRATYLELDIQIVNGEFVYKLFDKRDDFPFHIVRMPDLSSNIPDHIFYGSFLAEVLRIGRASLRYNHFLPRVKDIYNRMLNQGGIAHKLHNTISKALSRNPKISLKYGKDFQEILSDIKQ